jgi:HPt (histidine-containing phosphotransfer) domain-containing protein
MDDYVSKPVRAEEVFKTIEKLLARTEKAASRDAATETSSACESKTLDFAAALEVVDGSKELFCEIAQMFIDSWPETLASLRNTIAGENVEALEREAHTLKGSLGNLGAQRGREVAHQLQILGTQESLNKPEVERILADLDTEVKAVIAELEKYLDA